MTVTRVTAATRVRLPYGTPKLKNLDDSNRSHTSRNVGALPESLQLFVFLFRFDQHRQIGISIFPECKELLISLARFRRIAAHRRRACQTEMGQRVQNREWRVASMIENLLEFHGRFCATPEFQVSLTAEVLRPELGGCFVTLRAF